MNRYNGSAFVGMIVTLGIVVVLGLWLAFTAVNAYNTGNEFEQGIVAVYEDNENVLAQYSLKVQEVAQIPEMYKDDILEVYTGVMTGRYGENGSQAMWQWLQEQNPQLDASVYSNIQQIIDSGRSEFQVAQTKLVDQKRAYRTQLGYAWTGFWLRIVGKPSIKIGFPIGSTDDYEIITTSRASNAFETGTEEAIDLRSN